MENVKRLKSLAYNSTKAGISIDDLSDEILLEILCRLRSYSTALRCKPVSKRWCVLISDPSFATQGFSTHVETDEDEQPWTSLLIPYDRPPSVFVAQPYCKPVFRSRTSLGYLPKPYKICSTFKDLVLSSNPDYSTNVGQFYVSNMLTKQWITLPPSPSHKKPLWVGLVGRKDGCFRVVVLHSVSEILTEDGFKIHSLFIYLSETGEWKYIDLLIAIRRQNYWYDLGTYTGVVCKSMVCFRWCDCLGAFNPFQVNSTFSGTLKAMVLPLPPNEGQLLESSGKLITINRLFELWPRGKRSYTTRRSFPIWKLNLKLESINEQALTWELVSDLHPSTVVWQLIGEERVNGEALGGFVQSLIKLPVLDVHPNKEHLVYLTASDANKLLVCDTRTKTLKGLTRGSMGGLLPCHSLLKGWPTPICLPKFQPGSNENNA